MSSPSAQMQSLLLKTF